MRRPTITISVVGGELADRPVPRPAIPPSSLTLLPQEVQHFEGEDVAVSRYPTVAASLLRHSVPEP